MRTMPPKVAKTRQHFLGGIVLDIVPILDK